MKRVLLLSSRILVIAALVFSSVGVTTISLSCPLAKEKASGCPKCKHALNLPLKKNGCCKATITHTVLKAEFEKYDGAGKVFSHSLTMLLPWHESTLLDPGNRYTEAYIQEGSSILCYSPVEKCALLSTFLI